MADLEDNKDLTFINERDKNSAIKKRESCLGALFCQNMSVKVSFLNLDY